MARMAGVSTATVSRILNSTDGYSPETRLRVMEAIETLGYLPLRPPPSTFEPIRPAIGLVFPKVSSMLIGRVLSGVQQEAQKRGHLVVVCHTDGTLRSTLDHLQLLVQHQVRGVIFASEILQREYHELLLQAGIPVVLLSSMSYQFDVPYVRCDDRRAACEATLHLLNLGHRDIAILAGARSDPFSSTARVEGYVDAHMQLGLPIKEHHIVYSRGFSFEDGQEGFHFLLQRETAVSALFACSDELAAGALLAAQTRGVKVPDQLSIMGFDNLLLTETTVPALTTVAQPFEDMGREAVQLLLNPTEGSRNRVLPVRIIERASVRSLP
ncbi:LacI family DNA-binding transcriptional regulator [Deinococcus cellulosilyticus]|uniref:LacI family DNA-binding transcriptional regulator n=1 Tax=Deinococcus cellulosilyticus TaxID=401558 RepID=UPI0011BF23F6|nr:substrate-binding domain-containing protein [Deinococcus cellulosilyticus]